MHWNCGWHLLSRWHLNWDLSWNLKVGPLLGLNLHSSHLAWDSSNSCPTSISSSPDSYPISI